MKAEPIHIALAEDDDGHATLVQRNLVRAGLTNGFTRFRDGQELLDSFLGKNPPKELLDGSMLLLLDINMPRVDGIEALRRLKQDPRTATLPIIILTTTDDPREVERCYQLGCSVYITKPVDHEAFVEAIKRLGLFLQVVKVPRNGSRT
jgi:CheY-like chemotaxis protein